MSLDGFLEVLDRAHNGPICTVENWDTKILPDATMRKLKEHGLLQSCNREEPVNTDDGLSREFFEAAFELAVELGMLCTNTERIIRVDEKELKSAVRDSPKRLILGSGADKVKMVHRRPEDSAMPLLGAPLGIAVTEDIYVRLMEGIVRHKLVDGLWGASLITVHGREIRSGTPYETVSGRLETEYRKEALQRAGRPGMFSAAVLSAVTELAQFTGYGTIGGVDTMKNLALVLSPAELKTTYASLNKVAHALMLGGRVHAGTATMIGGYAGPPEGAALVAIAGAILRLFIHRSSTATPQLMDSRYSGNTGREALWACSIAVQSLSSSTDLLIGSTTNQTAGPDTEMLLNETAAFTICSTVSGASLVIGPRSAGGKWTNHLTPLECRFSGEVLKGCRKMKRTAANEILRQLIPRYESLLGKAPKGRSVLECYNLDKLRPKEEWMEKYREVRKHLEELSVNFA